ncbi:MAG: polyamine aminopropyltransferase [Planctomycetes bacterium]|nr:polyamine aminopropyltransferase [Planctomycetota bacterium]
MSDVEDWYTERLLGRAGYSLPVRKRLHKERSAFQEIEVFDSLHHGRVLALDGAIMLTELDEFPYHELLTHPALWTLQKAERAFLVGGGDGGTVGELLRRDGLEITVAEIDERVVRVSQEYFPELAKSLDDPRVTLSFADGVAALREAEGSGLDLVVVDGTDPVGPAAGLIESEFYETVAAALSPAGVFTAQTQSPFYHPEAITKIYRGLGEAFANVRMYWGVCPSYLGAFWTFAYASQERDPLRDLVPPTGLETRYWTPEVHRAAFVLPPFVQACLPEGHPQRTHV